MPEGSAILASDYTPRVTPARQFQPRRTSAARIAAREINFKPALRL
jgi:hypothetical protein